MKVRDAIKMIEKDGWYWHRTNGDHHIYKHPFKPGIVVVPGHERAEVAPGTLGSIKRQAGLK